MLIPRSVVAERISALAKQINADYHGEEVLFVGIMNGSFIFAADLLREIKLDATVSFIRLSSYCGQSSTGQVQCVAGLDGCITGKNIVVLEDIVETGNTLEYALRLIRKEHPKRVAVAVLLSKPPASARNVAVDYVGFEVEDRFVAGLGLDYDGFGRNLDSLYMMV